MFRPRIIPCLLLRGDGLVKTTRFTQPRYLGDPMNAVRIFNERRADEVIFLDISATPNGRCISPDLIRRIGEECSSPFAVGGGVNCVEQIRSLFQAGAEKVVLNTVAFERPELVSEAAKIFGSQSIVISIDVIGAGESRQVVIRSGSERTGVNPVDQARKMESFGAGEILITSVDREGTMQGYDFALCAEVSSAVNIPVIAHGGAASLGDMKRVLAETSAMAAAAGSLFVFHGPLRGVLINFPSQKELMTLVRDV